MKRRRSGRLQVFQNGVRVGTLSREPSGAIYFQYDDHWLDNPAASPISLSLPLVDARYSGIAVAAVFDNLLPDSDQVRRQVAERTGADGHDPYSLLEAIGRDCSGALQFIPGDEDPDGASAVTGQPLTEAEVATMLRNLHKTPLGITMNRDFRISVAGAQEKTALLFWKNRWHRPKGTTATTHILKPQIGKLSNGLDLSNSVENEHFCMRLLPRLGLPAAQTEILDFEEVRVLSVRRFDRTWNGKSSLLRKPQEDCLQALGVPSARKYQADGGLGITEILTLLRGSDRPTHDQKILLKAQICFWLLDATDGHAKNFSLFLGSGGRFILTPLYDVMSAQPLFAAKQMLKKDMKLAMGVGKNRHYQVDQISLRHFEESAAMAGVDVRLIREIADEVYNEWDQALEETLHELGPTIALRMAEQIVAGSARRLKQLK